RFDNLKAVVVLRNPVDCINSQLGAFSFFGDEFHPSDSARFKAELDICEEWRSESEASANWWRHMNEAALKACERYPDRTFILPYEAIKTNPVGVSSALADFFGVECSSDVSSVFERPVGDITKKTFLRQDDLDRLYPLCKDYLVKMENLSSVSTNGSLIDFFESILAKYEKIGPGSYTPPISRDLTGLRVRHHLIHERQTHAGEMHALTAKLSGVEHGLKVTQRTLSKERQEHNKARLQHEKERQDHKASRRRAEAAESDLAEAKKTILLCEAEVTALLAAKQGLEKNVATLNERISLLEWVLAPRLRSIIELRALRYVLNERRRIQRAKRAGEAKPAEFSQQTTSQTEPAAPEC
ncbi:MAG: sulfotransferase domain-containing protein, partial [Hyphococcus sp.]